MFKFSKYYKESYNGVELKIGEEYLYLKHDPSILHYMPAGNSKINKNQKLYQLHSILEKKLQDESINDITIKLRENALVKFKLHIQLERPYTYYPIWLASILAILLSSIEPKNNIVKVISMLNEDGEEVLPISSDMDMLFSPSKLSDDLLSTYWTSMLLITHSKELDMLVVINFTDTRGQKLDGKLIPYFYYTHGKATLFNKQLLLFRSSRENSLIFAPIAYKNIYLLLSDTMTVDQFAKLNKAHAAELVNSMNEYFE